MSENLITAENRKKIDIWLCKYPPDRKRSAVLYALRIVQEQNGGWLTVELMNAVAEYLDLPNIAVYEAVSFYGMYETDPIGKNKLAICNSISCMLNGSEKIIEHVENRLGIKMGETTPDGKFTLREAECLAACAGAPMLQINEREYHECLTTEKVDSIMDALEKEEPTHGE
jgi:NADH-quinone oxidoreductase subunit E